MTTRQTGLSVPGPAAAGPVDVLAVGVDPQGLVLDRADASSGQRYRLCGHGVATVDPELCAH